MGYTIQFKRGTSAQWTSQNPVLADGEPALETDTGKIKIGDGTTEWGISYILQEMAVAVLRPTI